MANEDGGLDLWCERADWTGDGGSGDYSRRDRERADTLAASLVVPLGRVVGRDEWSADGDDLGGVGQEWL